MLRPLRKLQKIKSLKKKVIRKDVFLILKTLYVTLCISGLGYQLISISTNFFKYEVVSTIKIKLPGEEAAKAMTVCTDLYKSIDEEELIPFMLRRLSEARVQHGITTKRPKPPRSTTKRAKNPNTSYVRNQTNQRKRSRRDKRSVHDDIANMESLIRKLKLGAQGRKLAIEEVYHKYMTLKDFLNFTIARLECKEEVVRSYDGDLTSDFILTNCNTIKFILNNEICYRSKPDIVCLVKKERDFFGRKNVPLFIMRIMFPKMRQMIDYRFLMNRIDILPRNEIIQAPLIKLSFAIRTTVSAYSYNITRKEPPYVDNCFDYSKTKYVDWNGAIAECVNTFTTSSEGNRITALKILDGSSNTDMKLQRLDKEGWFKYENDTIFQEKYIDICRQTYDEPDCHIENTFTEFVGEPQEDKQRTTDFYLEFSQVFTDDSSFSIQSSPKFELVDYVSFVLGCLGTWLGFSFLGLDPISFIFKTENNAIVTNSQLCTENNIMRKVCRMTAVVVSRKCKKYDAQVSNIERHNTILEERVCQLADSNARLIKEMDILKNRLIGNRPFKRK